MTRSKLAIEFLLPNSKETERKEGGCWERRKLEKTRMTGPFYIKTSALRNFSCCLEAAITTLGFRIITPVALPSLLPLTFRLIRWNRVSHLSGPAEQLLCALWLTTCERAREVWPLNHDGMMVPYLEMPSILACTCRQANPDEQGLLKRSQRSENFELLAHQPGLNILTPEQL